MAVAFATAMAMTLGVPAVFTGTAASAATTPTTVTTCNAQSPDTLVNGSSIEAGGCLMSPSGKYRLTMQTDDNLVLYYTGASGSPDALWASTTDKGFPGAMATLGLTGNLTVTAAASNGSVSWSSSSYAQNTELVLQTDGNAVIYSLTNPLHPDPIWATGTDAQRVTITRCTVQTAPSIFPDGSTMFLGGCMESPDHDYRLTMQTDGNLVLHYVQGGATSVLWASNTASSPTAGGGQFLSLREGELSTNGYPAFTERANLNSVLVLQNDGNLVFYSLTAAGTPYAAWATGTEGNQGNILTTNETLPSGQFLQSTNGQYQLQMGSGGALIVTEMQPYANYAYTSYTTTYHTTNATYQCPLWSGPAQNVNGYTTTPAANSYATLQSDGNLVVYPPQSSMGYRTDASWASGTNGTGASELKMQTDGNLVLYNSSGSAVWNTSTNTNRGWLWCTGEILQGSTSSGTDHAHTTVPGPNPASDNSTQTIYSLVGGTRFKLTMQANCDLVLTNLTKPKTEWTSGTDETAGSNALGANCYATLLANGVVEVLEPSNTDHVLWKSSSKAAQQPFPITAGSAIGPFYAFAPTTSGTSHFIIANQAGNQIYPSTSDLAIEIVKNVFRLAKIIYKLSG